MQNAMKDELKPKTLVSIVLQAAMNVSRSERSCDLRFRRYFDGRPAIVFACIDLSENSAWFVDINNHAFWRVSVENRSHRFTLHKLIEERKIGNAEECSAPSLVHRY